jgi:hypothetical protein
MPAYGWFIIGFLVGGGLVWAFRGFVARTKEKVQNKF